MTTKTIQLSAEDLYLLASLCKRELNKAESELQAIRECNTHLLPETLKGATVDELRAQVDPWCSLVMRLRALWEEFDAAVPATRNWGDGATLTVETQRTDAKPCDGIIRLLDQADGIRGHYCIGKTLDGVYYAYWNERQQRWTTAGTVYTSKTEAEAKLRELT